MTGLELFFILLAVCLFIGCFMMDKEMRMAHKLKREAETEYNEAYYELRNAKWGLREAKAKLEDARDLRPTVGFQVYDELGRHDFGHKSDAVYYARTSPSLAPNSPVAVYQVTKVTQARVAVELEDA